jgi:hypothetical protein
VRKNFFYHGTNQDQAEKLPAAGTRLDSRRQYHPAYNRQADVFKTGSGLQLTQERCTCVAKNNAVSDRSKPISVKFQYIRELMQTGEIIFQYVSSNESVVDLLTKPLPGTKTMIFSKIMALS